MTHAQADSVRKRINTFHAELLDQHRTTHGRIQHDYDMPAIAWRQILDALVRQCYGPAGGKLKGRGRPADSCYLAIKKIADAVRKIEAHPALRNASIEGWVPDLIPAWTDYVDPYCSPYPRTYAIDGQRWPFVLLSPQHGENLGMKVTRWEFAPRWLSDALTYEQQGSWTFNEMTHLAFAEYGSADPERFANHEDVPPLIVG